jgi:hypothetical protein
MRGIKKAWLFAAVLMCLDMNSAVAEDKKPAPPGVDPQVARVLEEWRKARQATRATHQRFQRTFRDLTFNKVEVVHGDLYAQRPDRLRIEISTAGGDPDMTFLFVGEKAEMYEFTSKRVYSRVLRRGVRIPETVDQHLEMTPPQPALRELLCPPIFWPDQVVFETVLWPYLGPPPVSTLARRFDVRLEKEDDWWTYIRLKGQREWLDWQIVLERKQRWIRRIYQVQPDGNKLTVDFDTPDIGDPPADIWKPPFDKLPKGWERFALTPNNEGRSTASPRRLEPGNSREH